MAALLGHMNFWNASVQSAIDVFFEELKAPESRGMATIFGFIYSLLSLITVVENALVIIAVYKDPLKILKNSPSNLILLSLSEADLIVGLMIGPGAAVWFFRIGKAAPSLGYIIVILSCSSLIVSVGNVLLLTIDRYYALATPLCLIPWLGNQFVIYFCKGCHSHRKTVMVCTYATQVFAILNSALNPVLYSCRFAKFQATFQHFLRKFLPHKGRKKSVRINERRQAYNTHL